MFGSLSTKLAIALAVTAMPTDDMELMKTTINSYQTNRAAFKSMQCGFKYYIGRASGIEQALSGAYRAQPANVIHQANVKWITKDDKCLHILETDRKPHDEALERGRKQGERQLAMPVSSKSVLTDGRILYHYSPFETDCMISKKGYAPPFHVTPFAVGSMGAGGLQGPAQDMEKVLSGAQTLRSVKTEGSPGDRRITISFNFNGNLHTVYTFAEKYNYMTTSASVFVGLATDNREVSRISWPDIRQVSQGRFFPFRAAKVMNPTSAKRPFEVREVVVTALDVDSDVPDDAFHLDLPPGTLVVDFDRPAGAFRTSESTIADLNNYDTFQQKSDERYETKLKQQGQSRLPTLTPIFISLGVLTTAAGGFFYLRVRRRHVPVAA